MSYSCNYCDTKVDKDNYCTKCEEYLFWCDDCECMTSYGEQRLCIYCTSVQCDYHYEKSRSKPWFTTCCNCCICDGCMDFVIFNSTDKMICKKCAHESKNK